MKKYKTYVRDYTHIPTNEIATDGRPTLMLITNRNKLDYKRYKYQSAVWDIQRHQSDQAPDLCEIFLIKKEHKN